MNIINTSVEDLQGLDGIIDFDKDGTEYATIIIYGNEHLTTIEHIDGIQKTNNKGQLIIIDNPVLNDCNSDLICRTLRNHQLLIFHNNGIGCSHWDEITAACNLYEQPLSDQIIHENSFEEWNDSLPEGFQGSYWAIGDSSNVEKVEALSDGDYALMIKSNAYYLDTYISSYFLKTFEPIKNSFDLEIDCKCERKGECRLVLIESREGESNTFIREIWSVFSDDSTLYNLKFKDIIKSNDLDEIRGLGFFSYPSSVSGGIFYEDYSKFAVDNLNIYQDKTNNIKYEEKSTIVFPNPTNGDLFILSDLEIKEIYLTDQYGRTIIKSNNFEYIDINHLPSGKYILNIKGANNIIVQDIIKI
ncbi:MAG: hypothetical protein ACI86M_003282 [Saprospiraceae bacterium]